MPVLFTRTMLNFITHSMVKKVANSLPEPIGSPLSGVVKRKLVLFYSIHCAKRPVIISVTREAHVVG